MFKSVEGDIQNFQKVALSSIGYVGLGHSFLAIARLKDIKRYYISEKVNVRYFFWEGHKNLWRNLQITTTYLIYSLVGNFEVGHKSWDVGLHNLLIESLNVV